MACRAEVDNLDLWALQSEGESVRTDDPWSADIRFEQYIFGFQIAMYQARLFENRKRVEELCREDLHELGTETLELILLYKLVKVRRQQLKDKAKMAAMNERVAQTQYMVLVVRIASIVELQRGFSSAQSTPLSGTHKLEDGNLHHRLVEVRGLVFDDFDGDDFMRLHVLALDDLTKGPLTQNVKDEISVTTRINI